MSRPGHLLILRFSSLGDIAMTVPVIRNLLFQNPSLEVTVASVPFVKPLFEGVDRLHFFGVDLKGTYEGSSGMYKLAKALNKEVPFDAVADLHNVLRTKILKVFLRSVPTATIDKGRKEKKELTRPANKILRPLKSTHQRYADVFAKLGFTVSLNREAGFMFQPTAEAAKALKNEGMRIIGIAPFAQFREKMYPLEKMKEVARLLLQDPGNRIWLFGGREDAAVLNNWEANMPGVQSMAGKFSLAEELSLIASLDVMVSMDSANMHLASLFGVPVVSVWGGTHPWLGFYGWGQSEDLAVQVDLECRPSSVFGNRDCPRGDLACMNKISPLMIFDKIDKLISS